MFDKNNASKKEKSLYKRYIYLSLKAGYSLLRENKTTPVEKVWIKSEIPVEGELNAAAWISIDVLNVDGEKGIVHLLLKPFLYIPHKTSICLATEGESVQIENLKSFLIAFKEKQLSLLLFKLAELGAVTKTERKKENKELRRLKRIEQTKKRIKTRSEKMNNFNYTSSF